MEQKNSSILILLRMICIIVLTATLAFTAYQQSITHQPLKGLTEDIQRLQSLRLKKHSPPREADDRSSQTKGCAQDA